MTQDEKGNAGAAGFAWVDFHRALASRLAEHENNQPYLIEALRAAGVQGGLEDGEEPLSEIDPFTFFSLVHKHRSDARRSQILGDLAESFSIPEPVPDEFPGVPLSNPMRAWFFPPRSLRTGDEIPLLWDAFRQARSGEVTAETFDGLLHIPSVGATKLTHAFFWVNPERYCPIDSVVRPYLKRRGIEVDRLDGRTYLSLNEDIAARLQGSFPEISHEAWLDQHANPESDVEQTADIPVVDTAALHRYMQRFREEIPGFESFSAPDTSYSRSERDYKVALVRAHGERVASLASAVQAGTGDAAELGRAAIGLFSLPLQSGDGKSYPQHLVPWQQFDPLKQLDETARADFGAAVARLLDEGYPVGARVEEFVSVLRRLWESTGKNLLRSEAHAITTFFLFLSDPTEHVFLKTTIFERALADLLPGRRLSTDDFGASDYRTALDLSHAVFRALESEGWKPQDLIDVQSFLYRAIRHADGSTGEEEGEPVNHPLNQILYGPPGTGKTWQTARRAVEICDGSAPDHETELRQRYRELVEQQRVKFVSFHQSFSYEDFVEGIRPVIEPDGEAASGDVKYQCLPGVFREICRLASQSRGGIGKGIDVSQRRIYKISLGDTQDPDQQWVYQDCIDNGWIAVGFGDDINFSNAHTRQDIIGRLAAEDESVNAHSASVQALQYLCNEMRSGDIVVVSDGNHAFRAIGEVTGAYQHRPDREWYRQVRPVRWLRVFDESLPVDQILGRYFSQRTLYRLAPDAINSEALNELLAADQGSAERKSHVLIIDEINRANIARVMGELITLLEPDKRRGADNEIAVTLPYSRERFTVPPNLYVIGTMNTADRSIALLDTALRRRFEFVEVAPDPTVLDGREVAGVNVARMMTVMNRRIEVLFDRDHTIGHAYFLTVLREELPGIEALRAVFENRIIPLLEEYFFEDWDRIRLVLGDNRKPRHLQFIQPAHDEDELLELFGQENPAVSDGNGAWRKNEAALRDPDAYRGIYEDIGEGSVP